MADVEAGTDGDRGVLFKWVVILILGVLLISFMFFFFGWFTKGNAASLTLKSGDKSLTVQTAGIAVPSEMAKGLDPDKQFISTEEGFYFELPSAREWSRPARTDLLEFLRLKGALPQTTEVPPSGAKLLRSISVTRLTSGEAIRVEIPGEGEINYQNEFDVTVLPTSTAASLLEALSGTKTQPSLPALFVEVAPLLAGAKIDRLVANEDSILVSFSLSLSGTTVNGQPKEFRVDRWSLFARGSKGFFILDIGFSSQTPDSIDVWDQLQDLVHSFHVIET